MGADETIPRGAPQLFIHLWINWKWMAFKNMMANLICICDANYIKTVNYRRCSFVRNVGDGLLVILVSCSRILFDCRIISLDGCPGKFIVESTQFYARILYDFLRLVGGLLRKILFTSIRPFILMQISPHELGICSSNELFITVEQTKSSERASPLSHGQKNKYRITFSYSFIIPFASHVNNYLDVGLQSQ